MQYDALLEHQEEAVKQMVGQENFGLDSQHMLNASVRIMMERRVAPYLGGLVLLALHLLQAEKLFALQLIQLPLQPGLCHSGPNAESLIPVPAGMLA